MSEINLKEFLDGYKTCTVNLWDKKRVFREPPIKDLGLKGLEILEKYCIEGDFKEFKKYLLVELTESKQKELFRQIMGELGLA